MTQLDTARDVIRELGGTREVAKLTGRGNTAVSNWRTQNSFPASTYLLLRKALHDRDMTAPAALWRMVEAAQ